MKLKSMNIQLLKASDSDFTVIRNLVPYYVYDISEYTRWDCDTDGRWDGCTELPDYWEKPGHHPYLIRVEDSIAGFALVRPFPDESQTNEIGDFFVARKYKGLGIGRVSAFRTLDNHPGKWVIRVLEENHGALLFWNNVISEYTRGIFTRDLDQYDDPYSGSWMMHFYRFDSTNR
jgi:predicted acetyltransferase